MNRSISKLYVFVIILFALLLVWTSRWTVFSSQSLDDNSLNRLSYFATLKVKRGDILAGDGTTVLAKSVSAGDGTFKRSYPEGSLFSQVVGYGDLQQDRYAGLEGEYKQQLEARQTTALSSVFGPISTSNLGNDLYTTLNVPAQKLARQELAGQVGSVIAIQPQTGDVLAMYSNPSFNDNNLDTNTEKCPVADAQYDNSGIGCQFDLATQGELAPGSTFKLVTTAAALNTGRYTPNSLIAGPSPLSVSGKPLENDDDISYPPETLTYALTYSINTIFAQVGLALGRQTMQDYMERFGFYKQPPIDLPGGSAGQLLTSGERINGNLTPVTSSYIDLGRTAIGQANLTVTPLQMAEVVSTIADNGTFMAPRLATKVVNPDGQTVQTIAPRKVDQVMSAKVAAEERQMMIKVVEEGTGTAANLGSLAGQVAGKTGTATVNGDYDGEPLDDAWFVGLAPVNHPKIAVAVVLRNIPNGYGGRYSAPIAAKMIQLLLQEGL